MDRQRGTGVRAPQSSAPPSAMRPRAEARGPRRGSTFIAAHRLRHPHRMPGAMPDTARSVRRRAGRARRPTTPTRAISRQHRTTTDPTSAARRRGNQPQTGQAAARRVAAAERRARRPRPRRGNRCRLSLVEQRLLRRLLRVRPVARLVSDVRPGQFRRWTRRHGGGTAEGQAGGRVCLRGRLLRRPRGRFRRRLPAAPPRAGAAPHGIRLPDYDDLSFDVLIQPDQTTTYHGTMHREE